MKLRIRQQGSGIRGQGSGTIEQNNAVRKRQMGSPVLLIAIMGLLIALTISACGSAPTGGTSATAPAAGDTATTPATEASTEAAGDTTTEATTEAAGDTTTEATMIEIVDAWARPSGAMGGGMEGGDAMGTTEATGEAMHGGDAMGTTEATGEAMGETDGMMGDVVSAAYMIIRNPGGTPDRLIKAESDAANIVELHTSEMKDGVMSMSQVEAIEAPANGEVTLEPGGFHVMLIDVTKELKVGDTVNLTLTFENAGEMDVQATVREP
jgi:hypothetical protein